MIGKLKENIILLDATRTPDGGGGEVVTWSEGASFAAELSWRRATPDRVGFRNAYRRRARLVHRAKAALSFSSRLRIDGADFRITALTPIAPDHRYVLTEIEEIRS